MIYHHFPYEHSNFTHLLRLHFYSSKIYVAHIPIDLFPSFEVNITSHKFAQESTQRKQLFCAGRSRRGLQSSKCTWVHSGNGRRLWHSCRRERQANWNHWKAGLSGFETEIFSFFASFSDVSVTSARALLSWPSLPLDGPPCLVWQASCCLEGRSSAWLWLAAFCEDPGHLPPGNGANKPFPCESIKHPFSNHVGCREFMGISTLGEFRGCLILGGWDYLPQRRSTV